MIRLLAVRVSAAVLKSLLHISYKLNPSTWEFLAVCCAALFVLSVQGFERSQRSQAAAGGTSVTKVQEAELPAERHSDFVVQPVSIHYASSERSQYAISYYLRSTPDWVNLHPSPAMEMDLLWGADAQPDYTTDPDPTRWFRHVGAVRSANTVVLSRDSAATFHSLFAHMESADSRIILAHAMSTRGGRRPRDGVLYG